MHLSSKAWEQTGYERFLNPDNTLELRNERLKCKKTAPYIRNS